MAEVEGVERHPLAFLLGGWLGAAESVVPPMVFVGVYLSVGDGLTWAVVAAVAVALTFAAVRIARGERPVRALGALAVVLVAALVAYYTGDPAAYFWPLVLANAVSAVVFALSILVRWPLMGVIVGPMVGTGMTWRRDPALMRAWSLATWPWVVLNVVRAAAQVPLINGNDLWALAALRPVFLGLVALTITASWAILRRSLVGHPGIRHPQVPTA